MLSLWVILQSLRTNTPSSPPPTPGNIHKIKAHSYIKFSVCHIMQLSVVDSVTSCSIEVQLFYDWILDL